MIPPQDVPADRSIPRHLLILGLLGLLVHGWVCLTDYVVFDGWYYLRWIRSHDFEGLRAFYLEVGRPWQSHFFWPFLQVGHPLFWIKTASVLLHIGQFLIIYLAIRGTRLIPGGQALLLTALALCLPYTKLLGEPAIFPYTVSYFFFWLAILLTIVASQEMRSLPRGLWRGLALSLFLLSFESQFLLPLYAGFLMLWLMWERSAADGRVGWDGRRCVAFFGARLDYALLPILYLAIHHWLYPPQLKYVAYFHPEFSVGHCFAALRSLLMECGYRQGNEVLSVLGMSPLASLGWLMLGWWLRPRTQVSKAWALDPRPFLVVGTVLLLTGAVAYAAVGREFAANGWYNRNSLTFAFPIALLIWSGFSRALPAGSRYSSWVVPLVVIVAMASAVTNWRAYAHWQVNAMKERAIALTYDQFDPQRHFRVVGIVDRDKIPGTVDGYNDLFTYILGRHDSTIRVAAVEILPEDEPLVSCEKPGPRPRLPSRLFSEPFRRTPALYGFALENFDFDGPQLILCVDPLPSSRSTADWCVQYLIDRTLHPEKIPALLHAMARVRCLPIE